MRVDGDFAPYGIRDDCNYSKIVRGVEDATPYTLARPCSLAEESAAGSRQSVLC